MSAVGTSADNAAAASTFSRWKFALRDVCAESSRTEAIAYIDRYVIEFFNAMRQFNPANRVREWTLAAWTRRNWPKTDL